MGFAEGLDCATFVLGCERCSDGCRGESTSDRCHATTNGYASAEFIHSVVRATSCCAPPSPSRSPCRSVPNVSCPGWALPACFRESSSVPEKLCLSLPTSVRRALDATLAKRSFAPRLRFNIREVRRQRNTFLALADSICMLSDSVCEIGNCLTQFLPFCASLPDRPCFGD